MIFYFRTVGFLTSFSKCLFFYLVYSNCLLFAQSIRSCSIFTLFYPTLFRVFFTQSIPSFNILSKFIQSVVFLPSLFQDFVFFVVHSGFSSFYPVLCFILCLGHFTYIVYSTFSGESVLTIAESIPVIIFYFF